jgi:hypothetical protein
MRNIARINNYYNRMSAWDDWRKAASLATDAGLITLVAKYEPPPDASWRKIDKARHALLKHVALMEIQ